MSDVIPLRPRKADDVNALWDAFCAMRDELAAGIVQGYADMELVCQCADAYRAWVRAYTNDRTA